MKRASLARRLRRMREREGLSQKDVARLVGWSRSHVANLENEWRITTKAHLAAVRAALATLHR